VPGRPTRASPFPLRSAHEHAYERNYPVYQLEWNGKTGPAAYVDFNHTVQMISGAAGCPENTDPWQANATANAFSAFRAADYGYGRLHVVNSTHMYWEYRDDSAGLIDEIWLVKHTHGPFVTAPAARASTPETRAAAIAAAAAAVRAQPPPPPGAPAHVANRMSVATACKLAARRV
jgi:hypothetical protein